MLQFEQILTGKGLAALSLYFFRKGIVNILDTKRPATGA